jgi:hypothetical protein
MSMVRSLDPVQIKQELSNARKDRRDVEVSRNNLKFNLNLTNNVQIPSIHDEAFLHSRTHQ